MWEEICYATGFYVSQFTAHRCNTQHDYAWCRESFECESSFQECQMQCQKLLSFHFVSLWQMCTPSQLSPQGWGIQFLNFLHIHLQLMWRVCKSTDRKSWMNYISEREPSSFIPLHDATALPVQRLLVGTNVFCDKDQKNLFIGPAAKDKNTLWTGFQG